MNTPMTEQELLKRARRRVALKTGWMIHALVYVLVNLALAGVNLASGGQRWHLFPLLGWGLGLAIHGVVTLVLLRGEGLRERMLAAEVRRLRDGQ